MPTPNSLKLSLTWGKISIVALFKSLLSKYLTQRMPYNANQVLVTKSSSSTNNNIIIIADTYWVLCARTRTMCRNQKPKVLHYLCTLLNILSTEDCKLVWAIVGLWCSLLWPRSFWVWPELPCCVLYEITVLLNQTTVEQALLEHA